MSRITPSQGRVVLYTLSYGDAEEISRRRTSAVSIANRMHDSPPQWPAGAQAHIGNPVWAGQVFPADVIVVHAPDGTATPDSLVNLQVKLDGTDILWREGVAPAPENEPRDGYYHWMPYQQGQAARAEAAEALAASAVSAARFGAEAGDRAGVADSCEARVIRDPSSRTRSTDPAPTHAEGVEGRSPDSRERAGDYPKPTPDPA